MSLSLSLDSGRVVDFSTLRSPFPRTLMDDDTITIIPER